MFVVSPLTGHIAELANQCEEIREAVFISGSLPIASCFHMVIGEPSLLHIPAVVRSIF